MAQQTKYYSDDLERYYSRHIEGPAAAVLRKLQTQTQLSPEERAVFSKFLAVQWKRVPRAKQRFLKRFPDISEEIRRKVSKRIDELVDMEPEYTEVGQRRKEEVDELVQKYQDSAPDEIWHKAIGPAFPSTLPAAIESMNWTLLRAGSGQHFLTSDSPVSIYENRGITHRDSELTFPVSDDIALLAHRRRGYPAFVPDTPAAMLKELNRRTAAYSTRFVYSREDEPWISPFVMKPGWRLQRLL